MLLLCLALLSPGYALADVVYESDMILVNKEYALPSDYVPSDLSYPDVAYAQGVAESKKQMREDAARALEKMFAAALEDEIELLAISGYRSYWTQRNIYEKRLQEMGEDHVSKYNARPGHSEHQTGLAYDVNSLEYSFGDTAEGIWLAENCHLYGFIIRYPQGKEEITGYNYEPWHIRYLGVETATAVYESGLTLEEYLGITSEYAEE